MKMGTQRIEMKELVEKGFFDGVINESSDDKPVGWWEYDESVQNNLAAWRDNFLKNTEEGMKHIMENHTLVGRINDLLAIKPSSLDTKAKDEGLSAKKLREDISDKVERGASLSRIEQEIVDELVRHDEKDHFPPQMSRQQIQKAIKEAYCYAQKNGARQIPNRKDLKAASGLRFASSALYKGIGAGLTIRFWFDFNEEIITTAFPQYGIKKDP